jgi:Fic family protein
MARSVCYCGRVASGGRGLCTAHRRKAERNGTLPPRVNLRFVEVKRLVVARFSRDEEFTIEQLATLLDVSRSAAANWLQKLQRHEVVSVGVGPRGRFQARRSA